MRHKQHARIMGVEKGWRSTADDLKVNNSPPRGESANFLFLRIRGS